MAEKSLSKTHNLRADGARLWATILETAAFGGTPAGGINRLTLSAEDGQVRDWFREACEAAGLTVSVDALGTQYALRPGRDMARKPIAFGSHLDTQPTGGKFDGVLGVLAGLEVMRSLNDAGIETEAPLLVVNWTNEEGSRFAPAMMASAAYAGDFTTDEILAKRDAAGTTVAEALDAIGYRGVEAVGTREIGAFVELHIEQGPILEAEGKTIGVVEGGQGIMWFDGVITGFESHAGTTPMPRRRDALLALSEFALAAERIALAHAPSAVASLEIALTRIWRKEPVPFDPAIVAAIDAAAESLGHARRRIISGAGHDACNLAAKVPAAMIFVPCKDGISHNEAESATQADCAAGADVLLQTVLRLANAPRT